MCWCGGGRHCPPSRGATEWHDSRCWRVAESGAGHHVLKENGCDRLGQTWPNLLKAKGRRSLPTPQFRHNSCPRTGAKGELVDEQSSLPPNHIREPPGYVASPGPSGDEGADGDEEEEDEEHEEAPNPTKRRRWGRDKYLTMEEPWGED